MALIVLLKITNVIAEEQGNCMIMTCDFTTYSAQGQ